MIPAKRITSVAAINFIKTFGAVSVLAHPFLSLSLDELLEFISLMKKNDYTKIIIYTGFTMEEVIERLHLNQTISDFKSYVLDDITLITDPFVESLKSYSTRFRGSSNQRVFHLTSSLESHTVSVDEVTHKYPWEFVDHPVSVYCI